MKRTITTLALAGAMMLLAIPAALATHVDGQSQDRAGHGTIDCRPGPQDHDLVGSWTLMTQEEFEEAVGASAGALDPTWDFCDKNRDGNLCVMKFDENVSPYSYTLLDNRPFGK